MKIGTVTAHFPPEINAGSVRLGPFVEAWAEEGNEVHVFTHRKERQTSDSFADVSKVQVHRVALGIADNTRSLPVRFLNEVSLCFLLFWKSITQGVDVYVTSSPPFLVAVTTMLLSKLSSTPYVVDVRDIYPEQLFAYDVVARTSSFGRFLKWVEDKVYENARLIVGVTEGICSHIRGRTKGDTILIRNGIDTRKFFRREPPSPSDEFVVIFHGTLGRSQNVEVLLKYGCHLKSTGRSDVVLRVIGGGPKADALIRGIEKHGLDNFVEYLGYVDFSAIPQHLNRADVGFSPRLDGLINETAFPVKVYECLGCGLPVVVTPESEAGRYVQRHEVGVQHGNDEIEEIHESILQWKEDAERYRAYSNRAVQVAKSFDRHALGKRLREDIASRL